MRNKWPLLGPGVDCPSPRYQQDAQAEKGVVVSLTSLVQPLSLITDDVM
jgi:hypothetical protein